MFNVDMYVEFPASTLPRTEGQIFKHKFNTIVFYFAIGSRMVIKFVCPKACAQPKGNNIKWVQTSCWTHFSSVIWVFPLARDICEAVPFCSTPFNYIVRRYYLRRSFSLLHVYAFTVRVPYDVNLLVIICHAYLMDTFTRDTITARLF